MKRILKTLAGAGIVLLIGFGLSHLGSEQSIDGLTQSYGQRDEGPSLPKDPATDARWRRFEALYDARAKRNVTAQIVPFLNDPFSPLRVRAARNLGRLEDPTARAPLQAMLTRMTTGNAQYKEGSIPRLRLMLSLGRVDSHGLKGQSKVTAMVKPLGLTWPMLVRLSEKINSKERLKSSERGDAPGDQIIEEVVHLLYTMSKKGEDVGDLATKLTLSPSQQVMVKAGLLTDAQEVDFILDSFSRFEVLIDNQALGVHLVDLKSGAAADAIVKRMQDLKAHPDNFRKTSVEELAQLFRIAVQLDDPRVMPLIKAFEANPKPWPDLRREAQIAERIEHERNFFVSYYHPTHTASIR